MPERKEFEEAGGRAGDAAPDQPTQPQPDENSFSYLAAHPTAKGWKRKLYSLLQGEGGEALSRLGSVEQYVRVLLAESRDKSARFYFIEALSEVVQEWSPSLVEPADRLHKLLSLVSAFTPAPGFTKTLSYLDRTEAAKRSAERVAGESRPVDLYLKGMMTCGRYYPAPPAHSPGDYGFLAYKQLLEKNLKDPRYSGYAAVRLLQLRALDIKSEEFSSLFLSSEEVAREVVRYLVELADKPGQKPWAEENLGDILVACARADELEKFDAVASALGMRFEPEGDYVVFFPTLTLANGAVLELRLDREAAEATPLSQHIRHSSARLPELLGTEPLDEEKVGKYVSGYLKQVVRRPDELNVFVEDLARLSATVRILNNQFALAIMGEVDGEETLKAAVPLTVDDEDLDIVLRKYWLYTKLAAA